MYGNQKNAACLRCGRVDEAVRWPKPRSRDWSKLTWPLILALSLQAPPAFGHGVESLAPLVFGAAMWSLIPAVLVVVLVRETLARRILAGIATWFAALLLGVAATVAFHSEGARRRTEADTRRMAAEQAQWKADPMRIAACGADIPRLQAELRAHAARATEEFRFRIMQECAIDRPQPAVLAVFLDNLVPSPRPATGSAHCPILRRARDRNDAGLIQVFIDQGLPLNC